MSSVKGEAGEQIFAVSSAAGGATRDLRDRWYAPWILAFRQLFWLAGFVACALIVFTLFPSLGTAAGKTIEQGADVAAGYLRFLYVYSACVGLVFLLLRRRRILPPTHIAVNPESFRIYRARGVVGSGEILRLKWNQLACIKLAAKGRSESVVFVTGEGKRKQATVAHSSERRMWADFFKSVHEHAPQVELDRNLYRLLSQVSNPNYTQPWLSRLAVPAELDNLAPLSPRTILKNGTYVIREQIVRGSQERAYTIMQLLRDGRQSEPRAEQDGGKRITHLLKEHRMRVVLRADEREAYLEKLKIRSEQLQNLRHEQIARTQDFFVENSRAFLVLEQIRGQSLRQYVADNGALSRGKVKDLGRQICEILDYMHGQASPVVHGGLSPDNLILDTDGTIKVGDLLLDTASGSTFTTNLSVLAPEQFAGNTCPQSDIYAVGAILYFLLCGEEATPLTELTMPPGDGLLDPDLDRVIRMCTQTSLDQRAVNAGEILANLKGDA